MNEVLERRFATMGARLSLPERPWRGAPRIDVRSDRRGEFFEITFGRGNLTEVEVVDVDARDRHLLLLVRNGERKSKFLCGHDERHTRFSSARASGSSFRRPGVISEARFRALPEKQRRSGRWQRLVRDPLVFAKGTVRHPDHATVHLPDWHRVLMNTEQDAEAMRHVAFID